MPAEAATPARRLSFLDRWPTPWIVAAWPVACATVTGPLVGWTDRRRFPATAAA
jgi:hypothetical protein